MPSARSNGAFGAGAGSVADGRLVAIDRVGVVATGIAGTVTAAATLSAAVTAIPAAVIPFGALRLGADLLGDVIVYCRSEALKYGLPLEAVLDIIMDSNESKLGADGKPIYDANGKFLKGPGYWKPDPKIKSLLELS